MEKLKYSSPARAWRNALPMGNGTIGFMVYGGRRTEKICVNDCTLWSGYPKNYDSSESLEYLPQVRKLVFEGKNKEADALTEQKLCGFYSEAYMPLGEIDISFARALPFGKYSRELDLQSAVHTVKSGGFKREAFVSYPHKAGAYRIESERPFSLKITLKSKLRSETFGSGELYLAGNAPDYAAPNYLRTETNPIRYNEGRGMAFAMGVKAVTDGKIKITDKHIFIRGAKETVIYVSTATGFKGYDKMPETDRKVPSLRCKELLEGIKDSYETIKKRHIEDYASLYSRQSVSLGEESGEDTDKLVKKAKKGDVQTALAELFYKFGKYMTIQGSRKGGQALNLQGQWNDSLRPPWSSNYTVNINTEMNYWGTVSANLADCMEPYINLVYEAMENGKKTAKVNYGCEGFACNHNVDIWRKTSPVQGSPSYMYAPLCGVWLSNELYGHMKNGGLEEYREKIQEIACEAAKFVRDYLVMHDGYYVTCPSASPEACFNKNGSECSLDYASAFELALSKQAMKNCLEFTEDGQLIEELNERLSKLRPFREGSTGICEWHDDVPISEKGHRHFSPLYGFYPGRVIKYYGNPEERKWVEKLFDYRTANSSSYIGWSAAWAICLAARLHRGEKALEVIESMLGHSVFKNLFCVHPPFLFQIDGNMGFIGGINEMLIYCEDGVCELLPAIPEKWKKGSVKGMVVNGAEVSFKWERGKVTELSSSKPLKVLNRNISDKCSVSKEIVLTEKF